MVSTSPEPNLKVLLAPVPLSGPLDEVLDAAVRVGADGVELRLHPSDGLDWAQVRRKLSDRGLVASGISTGRLARESGCSLSDPDPAGRRRAVEELRRHIEMAHGVGTDLFLGSAKGQQLDGEPAEDYRARLAEVLGAVDDEAAEAGVLLYLEAINRYEINALTNAEQNVEFFTRYPLKSCDIQLDSFHMGIEDADLGEAVRSCGDRLGYMQFADSNRRYPGAGHLDFSSIMDGLIDIGYQGDFGLECQPVPDGITAATRGLEFLRRAWNESLVRNGLDPEE
jgi:sugar phosphate isomerase/epimerase